MQKPVQSQNPLASSGVHQALLHPSTCASACPPLLGLLFIAVNRCHVCKTERPASASATEQAAVVPRVQARPEYSFVSALASREVASLRPFCTTVLFSQRQRQGLRRRPVGALPCGSALPAFGRGASRLRFEASPPLGNRSRHRGRKKGSVRWVRMLLSLARGRGRRPSLQWLRRLWMRRPRRHLHRFPR